MIAMRVRSATGLMAALAMAVSLLALPVSPAHASSTPTIASVPGVTHVGRTITVTGTGLEDVDTLSINDTPLTDVTLVDASRVSGTVPEGATSGLVSLTTASGGSFTSTASVTVAPPPVVTGLKSELGDRAAVISWTGAGTGPTIVRDVTGLSDPLTPASGREIPVDGPGARDTTFTNTTSRDYAVWARDIDGTLSDSPETTTRAPAPAVPTALSLTATYSTRIYPFTLALTGKLKRAETPVAKQQVQILSGVLGSSRTLLRTLTTASDGTFRATFVPNRSRTYSVRFAGDAFSASSLSPTRTVTVVGTLSAVWNPTSIKRGQSSVLSGRIRPTVGGVVLTVQRRSGTSWVTYARTRTASDGTYRIALAPPVGTQVFRVQRPALPGLAVAYSPWAVLRVAPRDLVDGMSGADVLALQRKLASLRYDPGPLDGTYGYSTHHAVMAFQKVERLAVTGYWRTAERTRVTNPRGWRLRYPRSGRAVEISITRQVLVLSQDGVVRRIIDVSTGNGEVYYQEGVRNVARTPRGRFSITRKIDGIRISKLGALYKPSYFYQGYAIHGSASVPAYPASHGCVRITNPNADRIFSLLTVGTPVALYDE